MDLNFTINIKTTLKQSYNFCADLKPTIKVLISQRNVQTLDPAFVFRLVDCCNGGFTNLVPGPNRPHPLGKY